MTRRRSAPPFWFVLCVAVVLALGCRYVLGSAYWERQGDGHEPQIQQAFFAFLLMIAGVIWKGLEVAAKVTLTALSWSVKALWWFATTTANGLKFVGQQLLTGLKKSWQFLRLTYDRVLKPAVLKFWRYFNKFRKWLDDTFGPVLRFLKRVRDSILCFYKTWVRPWLDLIDVTRRILRVLASMGLAWARALDKRLGELEERIDRPFRLVVGKLNEVIGIVNRVITLNGLIQRVALLQSLGRDMRYAWRMAIHWREADTSTDEMKRVRKRLNDRTLAEQAADTAAGFRDGGGRYHAVIAEQEAQWRIYFRGQ